MTSVKDVQELLGLRAETPSIVTVYLELDQDRIWPRLCQKLIHEAVSKDPLLNEFRQDFELIGDFTAGFDPESHKGLALFSARRAGLWKAVALPQSVKNTLRVARAPTLAPLLNILDQYQRYGVALVGPERARFLEVYLGQIEEIPVSAEPGLGRIQDGLNRRLKFVADQLLILARQRGLDRVIVGAPAPLQPLLINHLHTRLQDNLIVDSQMHLETAPSEVLEKVVTAERESRKVRESVLVYRLFDAVAAGGMGVVGLGQTLHALNRGQARMLLIREGLTKMGRVCPKCGALALDGKKCVYCWLDTVAVFNVLEEMTQMALDQNCQVFQIRHERRLDAFGGVGAELRFKEGAEKRGQPQERRESLAPDAAPSRKS